MKKEKHLINNVGLDVEMVKMERSLRRAYAAQRGLNTVDVALDEDYRPVIRSWKSRST